MPLIITTRLDCIISVVRQLESSILYLLVDFCWYIRNYLLIQYIAMLFQLKLVHKELP